jgi:hypothetical protein
MKLFLFSIFILKTGSETREKVGKWYIDNFILLPSMNLINPKLHLFTSKLSGLTFLLERKLGRKETGKEGREGGKDKNRKSKRKIHFSCGTFGFFSHF